MPSSTNSSNFATLVVQWQRLHGRHDLPWQNTGDPYRVWLSEIMLQQTQVATVRQYFQRFIERFPDVSTLAAASLDEVMGLWSGLGYYSRARNLHRCAKAVVQIHGGQFPRDAQTLVTLPGIGRSTAAAISSLCFGERVAILDANVRRVVTRVLGFSLDLAQARNERALWEAATALLPTEQRALEDMPAYTQGMMDLGAGVCRVRQPLCSVCPVQAACAAHAQGEPQRYPVRSRSIKRSSQSLWLLWASDARGAVWLQQRPEHGIWAGLYALPSFESEVALRESLPVSFHERLEALPAFVHVLTHRDLHLHPVRLRLPDTASADALGGTLAKAQWFSPTQWPVLGLPAPVRRLLTEAATKVLI